MPESAPHIGKPTAGNPLIPDRDPSPTTELAARVWTAMQAFVTAHDQRKTMQDALDLGRGLGRVKLLLALADGPLTHRQIAEANELDAPYVTLIVDKLVERGLVARTAHPDDNRRKLVALTPAGRDAAALALRILADPPAPLAALPREDLAVLDRVLTELDTRSNHSF